jgi:hypothetical protein
LDPFKSRFRKHMRAVGGGCCNAEAVLPCDKIQSLNVFALVRGTSAIHAAERAGFYLEGEMLHLQ